MPFVLYLLLGIVLLILVSGGYTFFFACRRGKELPWGEPEKLVGTSHEKYKNLIAGSIAYLQAHNTREIYVTSQDGFKLHGLWVPAPNPKGTILLAHGYRSSKLLDFGMVLSFYQEKGLNILLPTQRAHGKSEGRYITFGVKESRDMLCWLDWHNKHNPNLPLVLSGLSMGASTVLFMADYDLPPNVKAIIADCGFTSPAAIISKVFRQVTHLPAVPSVWAAELFARVFAGFSLYACSSVKALENCRLPVLLAHGLADDFVPNEMSRQAYAACKSKKELLLAENAGHGLSFLREPEKYKALVEKILQEAI